MQRDESYNKAYSLYADGDYEEAYAVIASSTTITPQELEVFKANCLSLITEQYVYLIRQDLDEGNYADAQRLKSDYEVKYSHSGTIGNLFIHLSPEETYRDSIEHDEKPKSSSRALLWGAVAIVIVGVCAVAYFVNRDSSHAEEMEAEAIEAEFMETAGSEPIAIPSKVAESSKKVDLYAQEFGGNLNTEYFDPFDGLFGDVSKMATITLRIKLSKDNTYKSTIFFHFYDPDIRIKLQENGQDPDFEQTNYGTISIDGDQLILHSHDGNSDRFTIDRDEGKLYWILNGAKIATLSPQ